MSEDTWHPIGELAQRIVERLAKERKPEKGADEKTPERENP
jgi:hypothetical protein